MALIDVVRWNGTPDVFAWRFPETNLTTFTQLVVNQSQEAVLFDKGKLLRKFGPGKHTLSTENIPLLENLYGIPFGGQNPFTAEVWFVNKVTALDVKWGTQQPFLVRDPEFKVVIPVRGFGQFGVTIEDAEKFLVKLVGTLPLFDRQRLVDYFRGMLLSRATAVIARTVTERKISVLDIAARIAELSDQLRDDLSEQFLQFGIRLVNFFVNQISVPEDDPAVVELRKALSKKADMDIRGYTYQQERSYDVLQNAANNEGVAGGVMGAGMGLGMGFGVGGALNGLMQGVLANTMHTQTAGQQTATSCVSCGTPIPGGGKFCPLCGRLQAGPATQAAVRKCDKCGSEVPSGAKFCPRCGDPYNPCPSCGGDVAADATVCPACGKPMPVVCPGCGESVAADAKFCPSCGTAMRGVCPSCGCEVRAQQAFCAGCGTKIGK